MDEREQLLSELESHLERFWSLYGITDDDVKKELLSALIRRHKKQVMAETITLY